MLRGKQWAAMPILMLAVIVGVEAQGGGKGKKATTPEEAVKFIEQAFKAGDAHAALDQMAEPSRTLHEFELTNLLTDEALRKAFDDKFGKDPKFVAGPSVKELLQALKGLRVHAKQDKGGGKVELKVWVTDEHKPGKTITIEHTWIALKQGDAWKLLVPVGGPSGKVATRKGPDGKDVEVEIGESGKDPDPKEIGYIKNSLPKFKDLMEKLARQIKEGAYKTRPEADQAVRAALGAFRQANPPPKLDTKEGKSEEKKK
ncbi:MAG TPA: hypothetical protein VEL76_17835 [Gemmataceae bacterium]|nr:hypothetical protein [Gemmataceae bacterium]